MTLDQMLEVINQLSDDDLRTLRDAIDRRQREVIKARVEAFDEAVAALREGLTQEEIDDIVWAMNVEYVEPPDNE